MVLIVCCMYINMYPICMNMRTSNARDNLKIIRQLCTIKGSGISDVSDLGKYIVTLEYLKSGIPFLV